MPARAEHLVLLPILLAFVAALFELLRAVFRTTSGNGYVRAVLLKCGIRSTGSFCYSSAECSPLTVRNRCASIDRRRHPHRGKSMKRAGILFVLAVLGACPAPAGASDCLVTMAQYQQLHLGMSEAQVVAI